VDLRAPDIIRIEDLRLNWNLSLSFGIDLSSILPDFCLPQVCVNIPCVGRVCTPRICIDWPTITVPVSFGDFVKATADFKLDISLGRGKGKGRGVILALPNLQFGTTTALLLAAIAAAVTPILLAIPFIGPFLAIALDAILLANGLAGVTRLPPAPPPPAVTPTWPAIPFIGPFLAIAVDAILLAIGIAGVTGFLGPILTPFVSGLKIPIYDQPKLFQILPAESAVDPQV